MNGFYWLIDDAIAGCGRPGHRRRGEATDSPSAIAALEEDLAWLRHQGIASILSLTETPLTTGALERHDLTGLHLPIVDMRAPTAEQFRQSLAFLDEQRGLGRRVVVHCLVGQGRTGSILAAYLIRGGLDADAALRQVRAVCPNAVENPEQERALAEFAADRSWIV